MLFFHTITENTNDLRSFLSSLKTKSNLRFRIFVVTFEKKQLWFVELDTLDGKYSGEQITIALKFPHEHYARSFHAIVTQHIVSFSPPISAVPQRLIVTKFNKDYVRNLSFGVHALARGTLQILYCCEN